VPAIPGWVPPSTGGQRLNLPARAFGVGTNLTLPYAGHEDEPLEVLELPDDALTMGLPPLGNPAPGRRAQPADPWKKPGTGIGREPPVTAADHPRRSW
jgi:hypothetical protein